uniref:Rubicon Homology domain-containing protein n=1 Tax=Ditylenchus dipsaci TaxID=166011 RepID=A0A915EBQ2_9BILA
MSGETDKPVLRRPFNLTDTVCSITQAPQKQIFTGTNHTSTIEDDGGDDWCQLQINDQQVSKKQVWESSKSSQTESIHLYLSDMLISSIEQQHWNELRANLDFSQSIDPRLYFPVVSSSEQIPSNLESQSAPAVDDQQASCSNSHPNVDESPFQKYEGNSIFYAHSTGQIPSSSSDNVLLKDGCSGAAGGEASSLVIPSSFQLPSAEDVDTSTEPVVNALLNYFKERRRSISFNESSLAADLACVASYAEAPEKLIPIPNEIPISSEEFYNVDGKRIRLRGSTAWAPPKKKFIFDIQPLNAKDFSAFLLHQKYRCAGCGLQLDNFYAKRCRLCYYYSKLFCQCCHQGLKSRIPAQILHLWNFKEYPVCDTAYKFLKDNEEQAVFNVQAIQPALYKKVTKLRKVRQLRVQLSHMWQYIQLCPSTELQRTPIGYLKTMFESIPKRFLILENVDVFSLLDFICIANRNMLETLEPIAVSGAAHIENCSKCQQRGFLCQVCIDAKDLLFPFQLNRVYRCEECGSLTHIKCHDQELKQNGEHKCSKCERIHRKRIRQARLSEAANSLDYSSE